MTDITTFEQFENRSIALAKLEKLRRDYQEKFNASWNAMSISSAALKSLIAALVEDAADQIGRVIVVEGQSYMIRRLDFVEDDEKVFVVPIVSSKTLNGKWGKRGRREKTLFDLWFDHETREWS